MPLLILIALSIVAVFLNSGNSLFIPSIVNAVLAVWSNGVIANYAHEHWNAPDWAATVSMITGAVTVGLIIASFFL